MATIFRFIVEDKATKALGTNVRISADGEVLPKAGAGVKNILGTGTSHGGVEHNKYSRAINPMMNKFTGGWWEKGRRLSSSALDVASSSKADFMYGAKMVGGVLIIQFALMELARAVERTIKEANQANQSNYLRIRSGLQVLGSDYQVKKSVFGKITFKSQ